ncbi:Anti-sigma regulatory factor (Ser/Thr protein kinase) [Lentzea fradiae]|uniref:Anti-sigma regulatory factor (Ser/Thr protein kinase) n=1 Tax=Lentzea fradiae TaxID=200378 RepID=A0A1G7UJY7_9PSEU|nr:anti-sigma factor RsbA family regulatory protein [Lentzea fradiae]SDG47409.1 Anti-sigma regulatory factor (Ser/Thr protein kinase) [Lentzea fradiae]
MTFAHPALFYSDEESYIDGTVPFVVEGLANGEPVAVAVPSRKLELLREALSGFAHLVTFLDMADTGRNPGRIIPDLRAFADRHRGAVRIISEPVWDRRTDVEYPACTLHEALVNYAFSGRDLSILCPYDTSALGHEVLADAEKTHPVVIDAGGHRPSDHFHPARVVVAAHSLPLTIPVDAVSTSVGAGAMAAVRSFAREQAVRLGLSAARLDDFALAVTELATNSVRHGGGQSTVRVWTENESIVCQVNDNGHITDVLAGRTPVHANEPGGRGLLLVNRLADLVRTQTTATGTAIQVRFDLGDKKAT